MRGTYRKPIYNAHVNSHPSCFSQSPILEPYEMSVNTVSEKRSYLKKKNLKNKFPLQRLIYYSTSVFIQWSFHRCPRKGIFYFSFSF